MYRALLFIPLACLFFCSAALAANFTVTNADDSGPGSFRQALTDANAAAGADTIDFAISSPGGMTTINLLSALPNITGDLTINGPGMDLLTINGNSTTQFRIFAIPSGPNVLISGLTVQNGLAPQTQSPGTPWTTASGGGIASSGNLTVNDCRIAGNRAFADVANGGGIWSDGQLIVNRTIFSGNDARSRFIGTAQQSQRGSAILNSGTATLNDITVTGSGHGGAVFVYFGTMTITRANIFGNNTVGLVNQTSSLTVYDSSIYQNVVSADEQGIISAGGFTSVTQNGVRGPTTLINTTISENIGYNGGGIWIPLSSPPIIIKSCTIVGNRSLSTAAGGVESYADAILQNSIVGGNIGTSGPADVGWISSAPGSNSYNLIGISTGSQIQNGINGNIVGTAAAPIDAQVSGLNYFGGEMPVNMPRSTSPAINAGSPVLFSDHDERGVIRPVGARQDIGAVEFNLTPNRYLPQAAVGTAYDQTFQAFGLAGYSNFQFTISAGSLPPGMTLQSLGSNMAKIAGTPSATGTFNFTVLATDTLEYTVAADYSISVLPAGSISFVPAQGRVTKPDGRPVRNAFVQAIDSNGSVAAESLTNPFGYFHFAGLQIFAPYTFAIRHKTLVSIPVASTITSGMSDISIVTQ